MAVSRDLNDVLKSHFPQFYCPLFWFSPCNAKNNWGRGSGPVKKNHGKFGESKYTAQSMGVLGKKSVAV